MNSFLEWWPNNRQKQLGEKYLYPIVSFVQFLTRWYIVLVWSFLVPLVMGEGFFVSLILSVTSATLAYALFRDSKLERLPSTKKDSTNPNNGDE